MVVLREINSNGWAILRFSAAHFLSILVVLNSLAVLCTMYVLCIGVAHPSHLRFGAAHFLCILVVLNSLAVLCTLFPGW